MESWVIWLIIIIVLSILEVSTVNLVCLWFIISALIVLIISFLEISFIWQFGIFVVVGLMLMIITKPILKRWLKKEDIKTNLDRIIGMSGIVTEEISKNVIGEVKVDGKRWSAISNTKIPIGAIITVDKIDGVKLKVHKEEN